MKNAPLLEAVALFGTAARLSRAMNVSPSAVHEWAAGRRPMPIERCVQVEQLTGAKVRRWHLRPEDWYRIWPELINLPDAPAVTEPAERAA